MGVALLITYLAKKINQISNVAWKLIYMGGERFPKCMLRWTSSTILDTVKEINGDRKVSLEKSIDKFQIKSAL